MRKLRTNEFVLFFAAKGNESTKLLGIYDVLSLWRTISLLSGGLSETASCGRSIYNRLWRLLDQAKNEGRVLASKYFFPLSARKIAAFMGTRRYMRD